MTAQPTITLSELAELLGVSPDTVKRQHRRWTRDHGFPPRIAIGWAWSRQAVELWIDLPTRSAARPSNDNSSRRSCEAAQADPLATRRAALAARYVDRRDG